MRFTLLGRDRAVGLDVGTGSIKALALERRGSEVIVVGRGAAPVGGQVDFAELSQAIHAALAEAGADGEPVIASVGGPDVVIRQVSLPPVPGTKVLPALELQHRELGLLPPGNSVTDAQLLRKSRQDPNQNEILSVSVPKPRVDERIRVLRQAAVDVKILDVEPLALLNGAIHLTGLDAGELLVLLAVGDRTSVLCLFSDQGPVVARYLDIGAETLSDQLRTALSPAAQSAKDFPRTIPAAEMPKAEAACRETVERVAEDIRLSLTFYRTEYDRESLPRYAIGGSVTVPYLGRWVADRLGLGAPLELMDPFRVVEVQAPQTNADLAAAGPQFLQAFGLALRGL
jgi:type IV pilus assembly protein PilM